MSPDGAAEPTDPSWPQYPCTVLEIHAPGSDAGAGATVMQVDLRASLPLETAERLRELGLGERWAVVTAYNPHGEEREADGNRARHRKLEAAVRDAGVAFLRADGRSPDASHREVGLAVALSQPDAVALAARFGQSAIFWFDGKAFWLVPAGAAGAPERLPDVDSG